MSTGRRPAPGASLSVRVPPSFRDKPPGGHKMVAGSAFILLEQHCRLGIFEGFEQEGIAMPYTMKDFRRDFVKEHFTPEERLEGLTPEERLQSLPPDEIERYLKRRKQ